MAGAIVQTGYAVDDSGAGSTTISVTLNGVAAGNAIDVFVGFGDAGTETCTVSDGTAYTADAAGKKRDTGNSQSSQNFYLLNVGSGTHTITATLGSSVAFRHVRAIEISGIQTSAAEDKAAGQFQAGPGTGANAVSSGATAATTNANDFVLGLTQDSQEADPGTGTLTAGTGYTISGTNIILGVESKSVAATGTQTATFTQSVANSRTTHVIAFKEASAGAAADNPRNDDAPLYEDADFTAIAGAINEQWGIAQANRDLLSADLSASGVATVTGSGASTASGNWSAASTATVTGTGASVVSAAASIASVATVTGTGASTNAADIAAAIVATLTGAGLATVQGAASISSVATLVGDAKSTAASDIAVASVATVTGDAKSTAASAISASAVSTNTFDASTGAIVVSADASISSTATVTATGAATASAGLSAGGTVTLTGTAAASVAAAGNIVITGVLTGSAAASTRRRQEGRRPKPQDDETEFLLDLAVMLVPVLNQLTQGD